MSALNPIKVLSIGNSFSHDATVYLSALARCGGVELKTVNPYIGGLTLAQHMENIKLEKREYAYELNGSPTGRLVSLREVIKEEEFDFVTIQQASMDSGVLDSFYPYVKELFEFINQYQKAAKKLMFQTWSYEIDSNNENFPVFNNDQDYMFKQVEAAYAKVAKELSIGIIPCGEVIQGLRKTAPFNYKKGGISLNSSDGTHLGLLYGRYLASAAFYECITGESILENSFLPTWNGETADSAAIEVVKKAVHTTLQAK